MNCNNCGASLSCSCQMRTATDGTSCCTSCIATYELKLNSNSGQQAPSPLDTLNTPIITEITHRLSKP